jgi:hypothetical protein
MTIDELLLSLQEENLILSSTPDEVRTKIARLLVTIERRPLRHKDAQQLKQACVDTIARFQLQNDAKLAAAIESRFSFEFIPMITKLSLPRNKVDPLQVDEISVDFSAEEGVKAVIEEKDNADQTHITDIFGALGSKRRYYLCSVRRQQTALWTAYRMYLDGTREFDSSGGLLSYVPSDHPVALLGAKKFKGGSGAQSLIWNTADIKQWKDKTAVGKLSRLPNGVYFGTPLSATAVVLTDAAPSPLSREHSGVSLESSSEHGMPAVTSPTDPTIATGESTGIATESLDGASAQPVMFGGSRPPSTRWNFRPPPVPATTAASQGATTTASTATLSSSTTSGTLDGAIALSLSTTGMDKLIFLNGIATRKQPPEPASAASDADGDKPAANPTLSEAQLLDKLDSLNRKDTAPTDFEDAALLLLRSRLPRKVPSAGGKTTSAVVFGNVSRVRAASRKNLALDALTAATSNATDAACSVEWTTDNNKPALLQVTSPRTCHAPILSI